MHFAARAVCPRRKQTFTDVKHNSLLTGESYTMIRITTVEVPISGGTIKCPRIHSLYQKYLSVCRYRVQLCPPAGPGFAEQTELRHRDFSTTHPSLTTQAPETLLAFSETSVKKMRMRWIPQKYVFPLQGPSVSWLSSEMTVKGVSRGMCDYCPLALKQRQPVQVNYKPAHFILFYLFILFL